MTSHANGPLVVGLGYVVVYAEDIDSWRRFGTDVLGMAAAPLGSDLALRMDDRIARIIVRPHGDLNDPSAQGSYSYAVGWECAGEASYHEAAAVVQRACENTEELPENAWRREALRYVDPAGVNCELFYGPKVDPATNFVSPTAAKFVMGAQGLGHVTISTDHCKEAVDFYQQNLGFQVRETNRSDRGWRWAFLSPGEREHSLAVMNTGGHGSLMHLLIEVEDLDTVGRALDRCLDGAAPLSVSLGRHWNDEMVSFYVHSPSGFDIEYGCGGRRVDRTQWTERAQGGSGAVSVWGHRVVNADGTLGSQIGKRPGAKTGAR